jgi:perosamine synthetase
MNDMDTIMKLARKHKLFVLEDCAQAFMAHDNKKRFAGTIGHAGSFSLENSKHITCGDGGMLVTNSEKIATRLVKFGKQGYKNVGAKSGKTLQGKDTFQDPKYMRHDSFGWNYTLPELAGAVGLAQLERAEFFVEKRVAMGKKLLDVIKETKCDWLVPQKNHDGYKNVYWTFAVRYDGENKFKTSWYQFRKKFIEFGGDGFYAGWPALYKEASLQLLHKTGKYFADEKTAQGAQFIGFLNGNTNCPNLEELHPKLMHFTTNQGTEKEMDIQANALKKAILYFEKNGR